MLELDCISLTPESMFQASGHMAGIEYFMVRDTVKYEDDFKADKLVAEILDV
jgi:glycyl-tRNA synthetase (class II)